MTTVLKTVEIVGRREINTSIQYEIINGGGKHYFVTLNENGTHGCMDAEGNWCQAAQYGRTCYHVLRCIEAEGQRAEAELALAQAETYVREDLDEETRYQGWIDEEYEAWKREQGLVSPMTREAYNREFDPNGIGW